MGLRTISQLLKLQYVFVHGGPNEGDYLEKYFAQDFPKATFYSQNYRKHKTLDSLAEELRSKLPPKGDVVLVGHSFGTLIISKYLEKFGADRRIRGVVLIGALMDSEQEREFQRRGYKDIYDVLLSPKEAKNERAREQVREVLDGFNEDVYKDAVSREFDFKPVYRRLNIPVLNIFGTEDRRHLADRQRLFANLNPHITNVEIPGAGILCFVLDEDRAKVSAEIKATFE